jgi:SAM-dependent methyltransferase
MLGRSLRALLAHPLVRGLHLADPRAIPIRRHLLQVKPLLRMLYEEWYATLARELPNDARPAVELGSAGALLPAPVTNVIRTDLVPLPELDTVADAHSLPFADRSLRGIILINVFHHLSDPARFLTEAARCVADGGIVAMVEPWPSPWSRLVYGWFHHEPFDLQAADWTSPPAGPLTGGNALRRAHSPGATGHCRG